MEIYKITNKINNKIYIGKVYNRSAIERFKRHCNDAKPDARSSVDRAIYKYGKENFIVEVIDKANSLDELDNKEKFWISKYNSIDKNIGYNLTLGGDDGNTYRFKTKEEMIQIRKKLSKSKCGKITQIRDRLRFLMKQLVRSKYLIQCTKLNNFLI